MNSFRFLNVNLHDKHDSPSKRRRGTNIDRMGVILDSGRESPVTFLDQDGEDLGAFALRFELGLANYLNTLGRDGWTIQSFTPWQPTTFRLMQEGFNHLRDLPYAGQYILVQVEG